MSQNDGALPDGGEGASVSGMNADKSAAELEGTADRITAEAPRRGPGRPSVVTPELLDKAWAYVEGEWAKQPLPGGGNEVYPMVEGLARYLKISTDTIYDREEFSGIVKELKRLQHMVLANNGLIGKFNPVTTKLILSSKHGYVEKTASESDNRNTNLNQDVTELSTEELRARAAALRASSTS